MRLRTETIRAVLAITVVGVFMAITAVLALYPIFGASTTNVEMNAYADFFAKTASVYTGIVGVIVGYYFGRPGTRAASGQKPSEPEHDE
jgi:hypothetical protein